MAILGVIRKAKNNPLRSTPNRLADIHHLQILGNWISKLDTPGNAIQKRGKPKCDTRIGRLTTSSQLADDQGLSKCLTTALANLTALKS
jgi:hypothetical protein